MLYFRNTTSLFYNISIFNCDTVCILYRTAISTEYYLQNLRNNKIIREEEYNEEYYKYKNRTSVDQVKIWRNLLRLFIIGYPNFNTMNNKASNTYLLDKSMYIIIEYMFEIEEPFLW